MTDKRDQERKQALSRIAALLKSHKSKSDVWQRYKQEIGLLLQEDCSYAPAWYLDVFKDIDPEDPAWSFIIFPWVRENKLSSKAEKENEVYNQLITVGKKLGLGENGDVDSMLFPLMSINSVIWIQNNKLCFRASVLELTAFLNRRPRLALAISITLSDKLLELEDLYQSWIKQVASVRYVPGFDGVMRTVD